MLVFASVAIPTVLVVGLGVDLERLTGWDQRLHYLILILIPFGIAQVLRGLRYKLLESESHPLIELMSLASIQGALNQILPARAGELAYPILMKKLRRTRLLGSAGVMIQAKLMDLFSAGFWLTAAGLLVEQVRGGRAGMAMIGLSAAFALATLVAIFMAPALGRWIIAMIRIGRRPRPGESAVLPKPSRKMPVSRVLLLLVMSMALWASLFWMTRLLLLWCGEETTWLEAAVASAGVVATSFLPINTLLGLGVAEAGWIAGLVMIGMDSSVGTALAFRLHAGFFGVNVLYGILGALYMFVLRARQDR